MAYHHTLHRLIAVIKADVREAYNEYIPHLPVNAAVNYFFGMTSRD